MSNDSYDKLHKLVAFLIQHGFVSRAKLSEVLGMSLIDFVNEFDDITREDV